uniref:Mitochondria-eating protein n=2 Tax=Anolis carolinensis TaxID=28377 RepID=H9GAT0_ANOCA
MRWGNFLPRIGSPPLLNSNPWQILTTLEAWLDWLGTFLLSLVGSLSLSLHLHCVIKASGERLAPGPRFSPGLLPLAGGAEGGKEAPFPGVATTPGVPWHRRQFGQQSPGIKRSNHGEAGGGPRHGGSERECPALAARGANPCPRGWPGSPAQVAPVFPSPLPPAAPPGAMAESLRRMISNETCRVLQEKLERWYQDYHINSCDQNLTRCCEIMELNSMIQGQLFTILNQTCQQGGQYAGMEVIKSRLLPWLGSCLCSYSPGRPLEANSSRLQDSLEKDRTLRELSTSQSHEIKQLEKELNATRLQLNLVKQDLADTQLALEDTKAKSATTILAAEDEIVQLKADLKASRTKEECALINLERLNEYEKQVLTLKDEIAVLAAQKSVLQSKLARSRSPSPISARSRSPSPPPMKSFSSGRARLSNASRHAHLVERFSDIYTQERLDAQTLLRSYIDDLEIVQRIIYIAAVESFQVAKRAFRQFKMRVRKTLSLSYSGSESLEDMVMDYIIRQEDLYDVQSSVNDVICAMNTNPQISFPPEVDFIMISSLIRELCRVAFSMQTLDPPLDVSFGTDGELFSEYKYRRSYDSEFTAPLVAYHVWPALMEEDSVIVKGEVVTRRGALWSHRSRSRSRCRSRSLSPLSRSAGYTRHLRSRNRSPSPLRSGSPRI